MTAPRPAAQHDPRPLGVFDSGIGGLTVVRELLRQLPDEELRYFGDVARVPYGNKSAETVTRFSREIAAFLLKRDVKALVVACNTASALALPALERELPVPVIGVIDSGARAAVARTRSGRIGVIATASTVRSGAYTAAVRALRPDVEVVERACPLFVPLVEEGMMAHPATRMIAEEYLAEIRTSGIESLILGCTHYPLLVPMLREVLGPAVTLVDSGAEAARATARLLQERGQLGDHAKPEHRFYLSDEPRNFTRVAQAFLGGELPPVHVVDQTDLPWFERSHA
jgi:glutamate racemase